MTLDIDLLELAVELRSWADGREKPRKRGRSIAQHFGWTNLTKAARASIDDALRAAGIEPLPSILTCERDEWVSLVPSGRPVHSGRGPNQIITWHAFNWTGDGDSGPTGEWLRCLKDTRSGDRQFIYSGDAVSGVVTYSGWIRPGPGFYEGWGSISRLDEPVSRERLLQDNRTRPRFDGRGIKALQGSPIRIPHRVASAISELASGPGKTYIPLDEPDYQAEPILWAGLHGLAPEAHLEAAVAARRSLWKKLGFPSAPERQRILGAAGRVDLIAGDVVGEAKRAVTLVDGPEQVERYLAYLENEGGRPHRRLRGVLLQCSHKTSDAVAERLASSRFRLELWSVTRNGRWKADRLA